MTIKNGRQKLAIIGLVFITFLSAIQYVFLQNVPDTVPTFAFLCITNVIGILLLGVLKFGTIRHIHRSTLKKGAFLALELTGFNFFLLLGSRGMEPVMIASVASLYFVFITPMLRLLKKKVNFFSSVATVIAIIALFLLFGADWSTLFSSYQVIYLVIADLFFAAYVVSVPILCEQEETATLSFSQMLWSAVFGLIGWFIECGVNHTPLTLPTERKFWVSAFFIGCFIRVAYGVIQISAQKYVSALKTSLIFSSEIMITLLTNPIMVTLFHSTHTPITLFQIIGCVLFIIAMLMIDENVMKRMGYDDLDTLNETGADGAVKKKTSVSKKMIVTTMTFSMVTLILSIAICLVSIQIIRNSAVDNSKKLGADASASSMTAIMQELENSMTNLAADKTLLAEQKLAAYSDAAIYAASYAETLWADKHSYPAKEVDIPHKENAGKWTMQRTLAGEEIAYADVRAECQLLGNMEDAFAPIIQQHENIATIYIGTENGLMVSYDPSSEIGDTGGEAYYEFRDAQWYQMGKNAAQYAMTDAYLDSYGRGLTITCAVPCYDAEGNFFGCIGIDILMSELNAAMVNDGIIEPSRAMLMDGEGNLIAGRSENLSAEHLRNIRDAESNACLRLAADEIMTQRNGIYKSGTDESAVYIAYATIAELDWTVCITTPVSSVVKPAVLIKDSIDENTHHVVEVIVKSILTVLQSYLVVSALILLLVTMLVGKVSKKIAHPLKVLEQDVRQISSGHLEQRTVVSTNDEIGSLAASFNQMTDSLQQYIRDLKEMTVKEERLAMELSVAREIQASMLPKDFQIYGTHHEFSLYASMMPAKAVGGDFYDFFMTDATHLVLVMADVSGKGVPAALFMAKAKTALKMRAMTGGTPSEILTDLNTQMCEGNEGDMFVTVWLAMIDLQTGRGVAANAGHEHPVLRRANGQYELVRYRHSIMIGAMEEMQYQQHFFELHTGDSLFVYTDGVTEATTTEENVWFGTDRLLEALNCEPNASPQDAIQNVSAAIEAFSAGTEQFDDITMLCLTYHGTEDTKIAGEAFSSSDDA